MALSANVKRAYEVGEDPIYNHYDVDAAVTIYEGSALGENASTGLARPLVAGDTYLGFAVAGVDNASGLASAVQTRARQRGSVQVDAVGVVGIADLGATVYASDDGTFTLTAGANSPIGKISRHVSGTTVIVRFEAAHIQSL